MEKKNNESIESREINKSRIVIDNEYGRYKEGGINRYAIFVDQMELWSEENILIIEEKEKEKIDSLIISQRDNSEKPNVLVKRYDNFCCISFHCLNKSVLGEKYEDSKNYMIK